MQHKFSEYESSDGVFRHKAKTGHKAPKAMQAAGIVFDPKPGTTEPSQAAALVHDDTLSIIESGAMPGRFNTINEIAEDDSSGRSIVERLVTAW